MICVSGSNEAIMVCDDPYASCTHDSVFKIENERS